MKPIIGISPLWDDEKESVWMLPGYLDVVSICGGLPIVLPLNISKEDLLELCEKCDGFLLSGGHDVDPKIYSQEKIDKCGNPCQKRDNLERHIFDYAVSKDKPILGICRGIQLINAFCGGDLYQDLPSQHPKGVNHQMTAPYNRVVHNVTIKENSPLHKLLNTNALGVNSYHHQAIKTLGRNLEVMATADDGIIEAVYMPNKRFIQAVQWHPEFSFHNDENSIKIVKQFIDCCL